MHPKKWGVPYAPWGVPQSQLLRNVLDLFNICDCRVPQGSCGTPKKNGVHYTRSFTIAQAQMGPE